MGLAASQARYLTLSARKSNCEYEGQQINQQRLVLSNQSATLFNQMLTMEVPQPPCTTDYSKLQYSWNDGNKTYTIDNYYQLAQPESGYNYVVTSYHYEDVYTGQRQYLSDPQVQATKTNNFGPVVTTDYTVVSKSYDSENDKFLISATDANGNLVDLTYKLSDVSSNKDTTELVDYLFNRNANKDSSKFAYDETDNKFTFTDGATSTVYTFVDPNNGDEYDNLRKSYGALFDKSKNYYKSADNKYVCKEDIEEAQKTSPNTTLERTQDLNDYYTDGTNYQTKAALSALTVGSTLSVKSATNTPTFSDYKAVGNCALTAITTDAYDKDPTIEAEIKQLLKDLSGSEGDKTSYERLKACFDDNGEYIDGSLYTFTMSGVRYFTTIPDLDESLLSAYDSTATSDNTIDGQQAKLAYYHSTYINKKITETKKALLETDGNGRFTTAKFEDDSVVYDLAVETVTDEAAYNDAMNAYYYKQDKYDKQIADINAKTELLQAQDRQLELKLEQLNTEQSALQTEMEACQKVVSKNIDNSFKTFSS